MMSSDSEESTGKDNESTHRRKRDKHSKERHHDQSRRESRSGSRGRSEKESRKKHHKSDDRRRSKSRSRSRSRSKSRHSPREEEENSQRSDSNKGKDDDHVDSASSPDDASSSSGSYDRKRRRRKHRDRDRHKSRKHKKHKNKKHKYEHKSASRKRRRKSSSRHRGRYSDESSSSNCSSSASSSDDSSSRHKKKKKKKKKSIKKSSKSESSSSNPQPTSTATAFANATLALLKEFPLMATDLPNMLARMSTGTSFDLKHVTHPGLATHLQNVFGSLQRYGVTTVGGGNGTEWKWEGPGGGKNPLVGGVNREGQPLVLIQLTAALLDEVGVTMEGLDQFEKAEQDHLNKKKMQAQEEEEAAKQQGASKKQKSNDSASSSSASDSESGDDEEEDGPAQAGTILAQTRQELQRRQGITKQEAKQIVKQRQLELDVATGKIDPSALKKAMKGGGDGREEWMLTPGRHGELGGIEGDMKKNATINKMNAGRRPKSTSAAAAGGGGGPALQEGEMDPELQKELQALRAQHEAITQKSLMEVHREQKKAKAAAAAAEKGGKKEWKWNRESDLDAGRRVDKNALRNVVGGAEEKLKDKFQGSWSKGFM